MAETIVKDPYQLDPSDIENAPTAFSAILRRIGPGLILASSIVGTGELIATTVLGAENGYTLLWLIILSCIIKIVSQNELGRYAIGTGETTLEAFDRVPGPRWRVSWVVWMWALMVLMTLMQVGAMLGGISEILNRMVPAVPITVWVWIINFLTVGLLIVGRLFGRRKDVDGAGGHLHFPDRELRRRAFSEAGVLLVRPTAGRPFLSSPGGRVPHCSGDFRHHGSGGN